MGIFKGNHAGYSHRNASRSILCGGDRPADNSEVVYDSGSLYEAIRASISIPAFFAAKERRDAPYRRRRSQSAAAEQGDTQRRRPASCPSM